MEWANFDFNSAGVDGWMGMADIQAMQGRGYTPAQIRMMATRAPGIYGKAQDWINSSTQKGPWNYAGSGGLGFGNADVRDAITQGYNYNDIQGFADYASSNQLGVGERAQAWLDNNRGNPDYMSWTDKQAWLDKQKAEDRAYAESQQRMAEARAEATWAKQQEEMKRLNPKTTAQNRRLQAGGAGGVRSNRSSEWDNADKAGGSKRSTRALGRGLLIGGLNI